MNKPSIASVLGVVGVVLTILKVFGVEPVAKLPWFFVIAPILPFVVFAASVGYVMMIFWFVKSDNNKEKNSEQVH